MDITAVTLKLLLGSGDLEAYGKIKLAYISPEYTSIFTAVKKHYSDYSKLPSFDELDIQIRDASTKTILAAIRLVEADDIDLQVAIDALIDQYTQNETIRMLDKFIDNLTIYDTAEVKSELNSIILALDKNTHDTNNVYTMADLMLFKRPEELARTHTYLGINNTFDSAVGGLALQELLLIGGKRGAGKSIISSNITCNQYEAGNVAAYFTIEMIAHETMERKLAILSDISYQHLKKNMLTDNDLLKVIRTRANMFVDSEEVVQDYIKHRDKYRFEEELVKSKSLKENNQIVIIDDRALTITALDLHLAKLKGKHGEHFKVAVVDYVNQIVVEGKTSQFDWQPQIVISKQLKELARKHDIIMVSPYQIDATGEARFAKGILDAADIAIILEAHDKEANAISFETTKIRGAAEMHFTSGMNWESLRISPVSVDKPSAGKEKKEKKNDKSTGESATDVPW